MPYKRGSLKGELTTAEIRKLIAGHNKLSKITIPPKSTRDAILKIVSNAGFKVNHGEQKLEQVRAFKKDISLEKAKEITKRKPKKTQLPPGKGWKITFKDKNKTITLPESEERIQEEIKKEYPNIKDSQYAKISITQSIFEKLDGKKPMFEVSENGKNLEVRIGIDGTDKFLKKFVLKMEAKEKRPVMIVTVARDGNMKRPNGSLTKSRTAIQKIYDKLGADVIFVVDDGFFSSNYGKVLKEIKEKGLELYKPKETEKKKEEPKQKEVLKLEDRKKTEKTFKVERSERTKMINDLSLEIGKKFNPFKILGITAKEETPELVKQKCKELKLKNHPDKGGDKDKFDLIQKACDVLLRTQTILKKGN